MSAGTTTAQPLNFQDQDAMASGLRERVGVAEMISRKYGTRYTLLTKGESAQMGAMLKGMTSVEKEDFFKTVRGSLPDARAYQAVMADIRATSPVTATAGSISVVGGAVRVGDDFVTGEQVSRKLHSGESILNPANKLNFPMPKESEMRLAWKDYVGKAYANFPVDEAASYKSFQAYYAAEAAERGGDSSVFDSDAAERAARAVTGGVMKYNGSQIVLPWGLGEDYVLDKLRSGWQERAAAEGKSAIPFEAIDLQTVADGVYAVNSGTGPERGKDGLPIYLRVLRPSEQPIPSAPASSYRPIPGWQAPK